MNRSTVILDAVRSPMGTKGGRLVGMRAEQGATLVLVTHDSAIASCADPVRHDQRATGRQLASNRPARTRSRRR